MSKKKHRRPVPLPLLCLAGLLLLPPHSGLLAQDSNFFDCRPAPGGDGWVCERGQPPGSPLTNPATAILPREAVAGGDPGASAPPSPQPMTPAATGPITPTAASAPVRPDSGRGDALGWVPRERLTPEELARVPDNCCGAFIEPYRDGVDASENPADAPVIFTTPGGFTRQPDDTMDINGTVQVRQGNRTVSNDQATLIDGQSRSVQMQGNVEFREPGILMRGSAAFIDSESSSSRLEDAVYVLYDYGAHGGAESIVFSSESNLLTIVNGEFSRCEPDSQFWRLSADSIVIDQQAGRGYATGTQLRIRDLPVFYFPFTMTFPLSDERVSGFLAPSTGSTRDGGFDLQVPYYFNLAPTYDATLSPRLISDRGLLVNGEARYLASWSMNTLNVSHLAGDQRYRQSAAVNPTVNSPPQEDRWLIGFEHQGSIGERWSTYIDYNAVSDYAYFEDFGSSGLGVASRTNLNRQARVDFTGDLLQANLNVQRSQVLDPLLDPRFAQADLTRPFDQLPQLEIATDLPAWQDIEVGLTAQFTAFDRSLNESLLTEEQIQAGALVTGSRVNLEPRIAWAVERPGWFFRPAASYRYFSYDLQDQGIHTPKDPDVGVGIISVDTGLVFERPSSLGNGFTQTLEPRLYYLNSGYEDQSALPLFDTTEFSFSFNQLFRDDRFAGGDRVTNANQLTTALTSRILDRQGRERARLSLGQINYFEDRLVDLSNPLQSWVPLYSNISSSSALVGEFGYSFNESWRVKADLQWNQDRQNVNEGSFQFNYQSPGNVIFNLAYRYRDILTLPDFLLSPTIDPRIAQTDLSTVVPLNNNWRLLSRWNYDHANARNLETFAGVEFSNCCATVRIVAREWVRPYQLFLPDIEPDRGIFFQFALHGLGNIAGGGLSNLLSDSIEGFRDPSQP